MIIRILNKIFYFYFVKNKTSFDLYLNVVSTDKVFHAKVYMYNECK